MKSFTRFSGPRVSSSALPRAPTGDAAPTAVILLHRRSPDGDFAEIFTYAPTITVCRSLRNFATLSNVKERTSRGSSSIACHRCTIRHATTGRHEKFC